MESVSVYQVWNRLGGQMHRGWRARGVAWGILALLPDLYWSERPLLGSDIVVAVEQEPC
jgi:hypothetical protein